MALPKDPRQKMINIMYLVLTAMLALNVSAEILNAFSIVNNSINTSNKSLADKNNLIYSQFDAQMKDNAEKTAPFRAKAQQVKSLSASMYDYVESLKKTIIDESGGLDEHGEIKDKAGLDAPTRVMENMKKGPELEAKLKDLREKLLSFVDPKKRDQFNKTLPLRIEVGKSTDEHGGGTKSWTTYHFNMVPTIAAVTILGKFQNDIKNSESAIIDDLYRQIDAASFKFDKVRPFISLNSKNLMEGQTLTANIAVGAYSTTVNPTIVVNGQSVEAKDGLGTFTAVAAGIGEKTISGTITLPSPTGGAPESYPFTETYNVGASSTSISADKMNVLYIGLQNPISISAAGVPAEQVSASITGGNMTKRGSGEYIVTVSQPGKAVINVVANIDGKTKSLGQKEFRVKRVPDPVLKVGVNKGGSMKAADFKVQGGLRADLEDFEFEGVKYEVVGYRVGISAKGKEYQEGDATSAYFPGSVTASIRALRPGDEVYFENVKVKGPDNVVRSMPSTIFKLN
ncbi:gliding motility protein GldM [Chitinophaga polysaccharea]|uniref:type IX secretion system motor protein PorM/GldM n=1 Tax=Chitinophaga TaxID=79328 RepID=UPI001455D445|nr:MULTISPECIES: gliding motility protein GldM [Chitinophaga]NLR59573.1 gliding motility protein GldM [Chitinophaga polysaccharea]NLU93926.1 gliding motility protein GldM [Chitinophaga sp. Ak27]